MCSEENQAEDQEVVDFSKQAQWEAEADEDLTLPEVYITQLKFEIVTFTMKKEFTFRCSGYEWIEGAAWRFLNVIIDTSKLNPVGEVELKRVTYHPELSLVNVPFMVLPAAEESE